jgi:hypothetical protein
VKIVHDGGSPILLNANAAAPNSNATLEDDGNFIVRELDSERVLWQSFDYPTRTLLPGMKLGMNFKTQHKWMLTLWLTDKITAPGGFSIEWEPTANGTGQLVMRHRGDMYWVRTNSDIENIGGVKQFDKVSNKNESYLSFLQVSVGRGGH